MLKNNKYTLYIIASTLGATLSIAVGLFWAARIILCLIFLSSAFRRKKDEGSARTPFLDVPVALFLIPFVALLFMEESEIHVYKIWIIALVWISCVMYLWKRDMG